MLLAPALALLLVGSTLVLRAAVGDAAAGDINTVAGNGSSTASGDGGPASAAGIGGRSIIADGAGNWYIGERGRIRMVNGTTGVIKTVAGTGTEGYSGDGGPAIAAQLGSVDDLDIDAAGNLYALEGPVVSPNPDVPPLRRVRMITPEGVISTRVTDMYDNLTGGATAMGVGPDGTVYAGWTFYVLRFPPGATNAGDPIAGIGLEGDNGGRIGFVGGIAVRAGNVYFSDMSRHKIRRVATTGGGMTTVAGGATVVNYNYPGSPTDRTLSKPADLAFDGGGNLFVVERARNFVSKIDASFSQISYAIGDRGGQGFGGDGGPATDAELFIEEPQTGQTAPLPNGHVLLADGGNNRIRRVEALATPGPNGRGNAVGYEPPENPDLDKYGPIVPRRVLDTRGTDGGPIGVPAGRLGEGATLEVDVATPLGLQNNVDKIGSVVVNVTGIAPISPTFVTVFPSGEPRPNASSLNLVPGQVLPNLVIAKVGTNGKVTFYNHGGTIDLAADLVGWFPKANSFKPLSPARVLDTRATDGGPINTQAAPIPGKGTLRVNIAGQGGVPASGVGAVVLNVTAVAPTAPGFVTVFPGAPGTPPPTASNLNFAAGEIIPNLVITKLNDDGTVNLYNHDGNTNLAADVLGWFPSSSTSYTSLTPLRLLDSRNGLGPIGPRTSIDLQVTVGPVPANATAVVLNVTAADVTGPSFVSVWPAGSGRPNASNLNLVAGDVVPNLVIVKVGTGGKVNLYNHDSSTSLIADVVGYMT